MIWIGRGFPTVPWSNLITDQTDALHAAIIPCLNLLRDARITLYSLDPAGISVPEEDTVNESGDVIQGDPFRGLSTSMRLPDLLEELRCMAAKMSIA